MSGPELVAAVVTVLAAATAFVAGIRSLKSDKTKAKVDAAAFVLSGMTGMNTALQAQIAALESRHVADRAEWVADRARLRAEHDAEIAELKQEHHEKVAELNERIDELGTQVYVLRNRPTDSQDRESD